MRTVRRFLLIAIIVTAVSSNLLLLLSVSLRDEKSSGSTENNPERIQQLKVSTGQPQLNVSAGQPQLNDSDLTLPDVKNFLPHLYTNPGLAPTGPLVPSFIASQHRRNVSLVIGIPSVKRNATTYLNSTLRSLLGAMNEDERRRVLIVVLLSDLDVDIAQTRFNEINAEFASEVAAGLIDVVSPSPSFYPDFDSIKSTLGDPPDRMRWRTKQILDYVYLMMYATNRGEYFLQLEDDVVTLNHFVTEIGTFTRQQEGSNPDWVYIQFAENGYIGKLFRNRDLQSFILFYVMFHTTKPVDWLLRHYVTVKVCPYADPWTASKECAKPFKKAVVTRNPSLFQHIGYVSSLDGKKQPIQERKFVPDESAARFILASFPNPPANLSTSLRQDGANTVEALYRGTGHLLASSPVCGDYIQVDLTPPVKLASFLVKSGLSSSPSDILEAATFEVKPETAPPSHKPNGTLADFFILASFDKRGQASGTVPSYLGKIRTARVNVGKNHTHRVAIGVLQLGPK